MQAFFKTLTGFRRSDFTTLDREVSISEDGTGCVDIEVIDDNIIESPEQFFVNLTVPFRTTGIIIQPNTTATVTILDDDGMYMHNSNLPVLHECTCPISIGYTVAVIGFTQTEYSVTEGRQLSVSLALLRGSLEQGLRLSVRVYTMDGSATGRFFVYV